jgi:Cys-rich four helix bundle protein (predicted Tat secretion target)
MLGVALGSASLAIASGKASADEHGQMEPMDHSAHMGHTKLGEAARHCASAGGACMSHCLGLFAAGNISVAACAKSVYQMTAICEAIARLAAANSGHLPELAKLAHAVCLECEKECRKHENEHAECKACAESCVACAEECKKHFA